MNIDIHISGKKQKAKVNQNIYDQLSYDQESESLLTGEETFSSINGARQTEQA